MNKMNKKITSSNVAFLLLSALTLLPGFMIFEYIYSNLRYGYDLYKNFTILTYYTTSFSAICVLMVILLMITALKKGKNLQISDCLTYLRKNLHIVFLLLFILWALVCTLCSADIHQSWIGNEYRNEGFITYIYYGCIVACCFLIKESKRKISLLKMFVFTANVVALIMMLQEWNITIITESVNMIRASVFIHFNHLGYYLNLACTLSIGLFLYSEKRWRKVIYLVSYAWQFYVLIVNNTFGGALATLISSFVIYLFFLIRSWKKGLQILAPIAVTTIIIVLSGLGLVPSSANENIVQNFMALFSDVNTLATSTDVNELDKVGTDRGVLWRMFVGLIPEHPLVGIGPDSFHKYYPDELMYDRPANEYISHAVFLGIPGLLFYLAMLVSLFIKRVKELKKLPATVIIAAGSLIAYLISAIFGNTMYYTVCYLYMLFGIIASMEQEN